MQTVAVLILFLNFQITICLNVVQLNSKINCPGILLTGGLNNTVWSCDTNDIYMYYPHKGHEIERLDINLTKGRSEHESVLFNGNVMVAMGEVADEYQWRGVDMVNLHSETVTPGVSLPYAVDYGSMAILNNKVWLCGGQEEGQFNKMSRNCITFDGTQWEKAAPLQLGRGDAVMVELNGHLYMISGLLHDSNRLITTDIAEKYSPVTQNWKYVASINQKRFEAGAAAFNGEIILCGGTPDFYEDIHFDTCEYYVPEKDMWFTNMMHMNQKRALGFPLVLYEGLLYALGGDCDHTEQNIEYYDTKYNIWHQVTGAKIPYSRQAAVPVLEC